MPDESGKELIIRLDERLKSIQNQFDSFGSKISNDLQSIKNDIKEDKDKFVTKEEFMPIQRAVFAAIGLILSGIAAAIGSLVLHSTGGK